MWILFDDGGSPLGPHAEHLARGASFVSFVVTGLGFGVALWTSQHRVEANRIVRRQARRKERNQLPADVTQNAGLSPEEILGSGISVQASAHVSGRIPAISEGFKLFRALAWIIVLGLLATLVGLAYLRRAEIVANPHAVLRVGLAVLMMTLGIAADIMLTFQTDGRDLESIQVSEVLYPLMLSVVVFYGVYSKLLESPGDLAAAYNAFTSGFLWRRFVSAVQSTKPS